MVNLNIAEHVCPVLEKRPNVELIIAVIKKNIIQ